MRSCGPAFSTSLIPALVSLLFSLPACGDLSGGNDTDSNAGGDSALGGYDATSGSGAFEGGGGAPVEPRPPVEPCAGYATEVVDVSYGPMAGFGQEQMPGIVLGAPRGAGELSGSLDVVALGNGGSITLGFGEQVLVDQDGPDLIVFENAFFPGGDPSHPFAELATVEVSADGETWFAYECTATSYPYGACAGWHPVIAGSEGSKADPHDPAAAGGDAFDLADVGLSEARFVRITDRPDTEGLSGSFDLDAVALVHFTCTEP